MFLPISAMAQIANEARLNYNKGIDFYKIGQIVKCRILSYDDKTSKYFGV